MPCDVILQMAVDDILGLASQPYLSGPCCCTCIEKHSVHPCAHVRAQDKLCELLQTTMASVRSQFLKPLTEMLSERKAKAHFFISVIGFAISQPDMPPTGLLAIVGACRHTWPTRLLSAIFIIIGVCYASNRATSYILDIIAFMSPMFITCIGAVGFDHSCIAPCHMLEAHTPKPLSCREGLIREFEDQLTRLSMGKAPNVHFQPTVATGKMTEEKVLATKSAWARYLVRSFPGIDILGKCGYVLDDDQGPEEKENEACDAWPTAWSQLNSFHTVVHDALKFSLLCCAVLGMIQPT